MLPLIAVFINYFGKCHSVVSAMSVCVDNFLIRFASPPTTTSK